MIKLNLGAGDVEIPGYTAIDIKQGQNVYPLDRFPDNTVDEIRASHILEHFGHRDTLNVLKNWVDKLKPGCWIKISVPDFRKCIEPYNRGEKSYLLGYVMGGQADSNDYHRAIFDFESLAELMKAAGLIDLQDWQSEAKDCASMPISLNMKGQKPLNNKKKINKKVKISAVMSMPRLCFSDNMFSAMRALLPLGIELERGTGVFWGQILTRMMERHLDDGSEYIITLDYDTWFQKEHVVKLCQLMVEHPEADAILPVQMHRESHYPLIGVDGPSGQRETYVPFDEFKKTLMPVGTGHFGLTIFRVSALKQLQRPWFLPIPGPDNSWNEGRQDEDIYFWNQFKKQGFKAFQANQVFIGHLQLLCTFPDSWPTVEGQEWKPINMFMNELEKDGPPIHCVPDVSYLK
jgi:predicted SAM-dependent methyltransferase